MKVLFGVISVAVIVHGQNLERRISAREFPSVFQAWSRADNLKDEDPLTTMARHDLVFHSPGGLGLRWQGTHDGLATGFTLKSIETGRAKRAALLQKNPRIILLAEIRYRDAGRKYLPVDHPWWKRGAGGNPEVGWEEGGHLLLDFANPEFQKQVAAQARAAVQSGVFDGVMLDWWKDDEARHALIQQVRAAVGEQALILANANDRTTPRTAAFINGYFMECYRSRTAKDWQRIAATLEWAEANLRAPRINCLETWYHQSRQDLRLMRATTAMALTLSDGYCLFSDPNPLPTPDHLHDWYPFWNKSLGRPLAKAVKRPDGAVTREFTRGTVVYNAMGNPPVEIKFAEPRRRLSTGQRSARHTMNDSDGDIFLR